VPSGDGAGGDLREHRREQEEVPVTDQRHVDLGAMAQLLLKPLCGRDAPETAAQHDDPMTDRDAHGGKRHGLAVGADAPAAQGVERRRDDPSGQHRGDQQVEGCRCIDECPRRACSSQERSCRQPDGGPRQESKEQPAADGRRKLARAKAIGAAVRSASEDTDPKVGQPAGSLWVRSERLVEVQPALPSEDQPGRQPGDQSRRGPKDRLERT
jgi:hypothetical protein